MARKQRKQSNRFDEYEESYHDGDFEYDAGDDSGGVGADYGTEDWSDDEYDDPDERETARRLRRNLHPGHGRQTSLARSVGGRESMARRKKSPLPAFVRPPVRKPSQASRSTPPRDVHRDMRGSCRDREKPHHGPHFLDPSRSRLPESVRGTTVGDRYRAAGDCDFPPPNAYHKEKPAKTGVGWGRFFLLIILLACGTAYTFYAATNNRPEGNALVAPTGDDVQPSQKDLPDDSSGGETDSNTDVSTEQNTAKVRLPSGITRGSWVQPDLQSLFASGVSREFQYLSDMADANSPESESHLPVPLIAGPYALDEPVVQERPSQQTPSIEAD